ncbi:uncharacterized protein PRCAT00000566001 [Priceomyces carsonii]|uniref:uncharacterized protein n=1 Tax=Priceomyces carsonii TaxID=28549 RepID=UPI002ED897D6|nr:unnamed protein product [Priceomyces carsonii]
MRSTTAMGTFLIVVFLLFLFLVVYAISSQLSNVKKGDKKITSDKGPQPVIAAIGDDFNWKETSPRPIRPFVNKKNFNVSMGISNLAKTPEDWLLIENTYVEQTKARKEYTTKFPGNTTHVYDNEISKLALCEFYEKVVEYLLQRYPQYFQSENGLVTNLINGEEFPLKPYDIAPRTLLKYLAANIEEDFLILIKDNPSNEEEEYILRASVTGFPAGFDPSKHFNKPISFIHGPVPQYESRLKLSMTRFFNRLEPKDLWVRHNWSIQTHASRFSLHENHAYEGQKIEALAMSDIDFENGCFLRVERQIFTRLPKLRANIMTVRTFLTPISQVKEEGLAEELTRAIDSLPDEIAFYKKRDAWGEAVKQYLRI